MRNISLIGILIVLGILQLSSLQELKISSKKISVLDVETEEALNAANLSFLKRVPIFGFRNLLADWTLLNFVQYFGESETRELAGYSHAPDFFEIIIDRDPLFLGAYLYLTNTVSVYAGQPQDSIRLMDQGLQSMAPNLPPRSYFVWRYKGIDEMLFTGDNTAAQQSFEMAAKWAEQSLGNEAIRNEASYIAQVSQQTAEFLATDPNSKPALINGWMSVLNRAIDNHVRKTAIDNIESLGGQVLVAENGQVTVRYRTDD
ncbi:hypothetical protein [Leptothoe kymatousa]|uniref:Uncharacterized protein n=1 Tax=Leptothoe kymatousa TAU-MAC 1615 TaxID=2364775 RepID=A0ABS5Y0L2_9CYAN|nr:hypothetical protein [Leptothoe kymatousa]MBT9311360.1 hypothetical protein [Leptothoe kymatousa TAU-MAC 1615]